MYMSVRYIKHQSGIQKLHMLEVVPCLIKISTVQKKQHRVRSDPDVSVQKNIKHKMNKGYRSTPKPACRRVSSLTPTTAPVPTTTTTASSSGSTLWVWLWICIRAKQEPESGVSRSPCGNL